MRKQFYFILVLTLISLGFVSACSTNKKPIVTLDALASITEDKAFTVSMRGYEKKTFWRWLGTYPQRWDLVVFRTKPDSTELSLARVIGLPGEAVSFKGSHLQINGKKLELPEELAKSDYLSRFKKIKLSEQFLKEDYYLLLSDTDGKKSDRRSFGPIEMSEIVGRITTQVQVGK